MELSKAGVLRFPITFGSNRDIPVPHIKIPHGARRVIMPTGFAHYLADMHLSDAPWVEELVMCECGPYSAQSSPRFSSADLPPNLRVLVLGFFYNHSLPVLPPTLQELRMNRMYTESLTPKSIPQSLRILEIGNRYKTPLHLLPPMHNLTELWIGRNMVYPSDVTLTLHQLPSIVTIYDRSEKLKYDASFPATLQHIYWIDEENRHNAHKVSEQTITL
jgi:hypothetical protein